MQHPFESIPRDKRRVIFVPLFILTIAVMIILNVVSVPLTTEAAPLGIISFEFAGNVSTAQAILDSWDAQTHVRAGFGLGFDFLFLVLYSTTIACACAWIAGGLRDTAPLLATCGLMLAWDQWLAALLDVIENTGLWITLANGPSATWLQIAWWCAAAKFTLVILGLLYVLFGTIWTVIRKR